MKKLILLSLIFLTGCGSSQRDIRETRLIDAPIDFTKGLVHQIDFTPESDQMVIFKIMPVKQRNAKFRWRVISPSGVINEGFADPSKSVMIIFGAFQPIAGTPYSLHMEILEAAPDVKQDSPRLLILSTPRKIGSK